MVWEKSVEEIRRRREWAEAQGGANNVERQHSAGRLTVRERIGGLVDDGSFQEVGGLTASVTYEDGVAVAATPAPYVCGLANIDGRPVAIGGEDFTVRGGTSAGLDKRKGGQGGFSEDLAYEYKIPLVNLIDGAGGSVTSAKRRGHAVFPGVDSFDRSVELLAEVPVVSAVLGSAAGGPAGRAILSHWSVMVEDTSQVFAAGPPVVARSLGQQIAKENLGGVPVAVGAGGTIDNAAPTEEACFDMIRRFLSYMPQNVHELPPTVKNGESNKQCHFIELCDTFHIPLVFLVDVPGFMVGREAERAGVLRAGMRAVYVASQARVPVVTVVIRKCYGMAGMATCHQAGLNLRIAWPSAEWGSLPVEGGVAVAYRREIAAAADPKQREAELEEELREYGSPFRTAEAFGVEDIIDPRETRAYLCRFINAAQGRIKTDIGLKPRAGVRP
jgi:acetyl-CoA carboxylase carboxyltransferase component